MTTAAQQHFLLSEANLEAHNTASAAQVADEQHLKNAIRAEAAQYFYQALSESKHVSEYAPQSDSLYLFSRQTATQASPRERYAVWSACDDPMPLYCKLAMQREAIAYASFESIDRRQRLALGNMPPMPATEETTEVQRHRARSRQARSYPQDEQHAMIAQQASSGLPELFEMQRPNVKDEAEANEEEDEGYGGSDRPSAHLIPAAM
ncbi:hypothetical protein LTR95_013794 [Oleoguttula sp. CCFEE 5521]